MAKLNCYSPGGVGLLAFTYVEGNLAIGKKVHGSTAKRYLNSRKNLVEDGFDVFKINGEFCLMCVDQFTRVSENRVETDEYWLDYEFKYPVPCDRPEIWHDRLNVTLTYKDGRLDPFKLLNGSMLMRLTCFLSFESMIERCRYAVGKKIKDSDTYCRSLPIGSTPGRYYQPVGAGDLHSTIKSYEVYRTQEALLENHPNEGFLEFQGWDVEELVFINYDGTRSPCFHPSPVIPAA